VDGSSTEAICENNNDANANNVQATSPQQLQLIRQCTAAALNLRASAGIVGGTPTGDVCNGQFPGITTQFNTCCAAAGAVCNSDATPAAIDASGCIGFLDAFNNKFDSVDFPSLVSTNTSADPSQCQIASGNHFVNTGTNLGPKK
jgi:hypothetical protein